METRKAAMQAGAVCLRVGIFIVIILVIVLLGQSTYRYTREVFSDSALAEAPGTTMKVTVPENVSSKYFAEVLEDQGVIKDASVFKLQMKLQGFQTTVKAGEYELNTSMKPSEIMLVLSGEAEEELP